MTPPPSSFEDQILRAIADGIPHDELLGLGEWTVRDVEDTLARHDLTVTPGGTIVRASTPTPELLVLAGRSSSPHVRQAAARAGTAFVALAGALAREHARDRVDAVRRAQKLAVTEWLKTLQLLQYAAEGELRRLQRPVPRQRHATPARQRREAASS
ncbi:hypothetical protein [Actinosynnema sp. NPDC023587]|uniref:hypothetical protein n=1 Tax=Actinosynnema sp. NPDC023587 TaxID=3154695 RepID=UPI00340C5ACB